MNPLLTACGAMLVALMLASGVVNRAPMHSNAAMELQTGPVILALAAPDAPLRLIAKEGCLSSHCPLLELRIRRAPADDPDRVHITTR
ncbi:MAG: hypothetical protein ACFE0P_07840 [Oceanicaulis sp.]